MNTKRMGIMMAAIIVASLGCMTWAEEASAQTIDTREHIEVTGAAEVKVVPDEFIVRTSVRSFHKNLDKASADNDAMVRRIFREMRAMGVERRYVVTDDVSVSVVTEGYRERGTFKRVGHKVGRDVMVILHDAKKVELVMKKLLGAGVDRLDLQLGHTKMAEHLQSAELAAAKKARSKADALAGVLGRRVDRAVAITEGMGGGRQPSNFVYLAKTPDLGDALSLGKLKVRAQVQVKFVLK